MPTGNSDADAVNVARCRISDHTIQGIRSDLRRDLERDPTQTSTSSMATALSCSIGFHVRNQRIHVLKHYQSWKTNGRRSRAVESRRQRQRCTDRTVHVSKYVSGVSARGLLRGFFSPRPVKSARSGLNIERPV